MKLHTGTIISGTLRRQDLLNAFANTLALHDHHNNKQLIEEAHILAKELELELDCSTFLIQDSIDETLEKLSFRLQELCPIGYFFGAHPDDGANFGVWMEETEDEMSKDEFDDMMSHYEQWLDSLASQADWRHQFSKEQEE